MSYFRSYTLCFIITHQAVAEHRAAGAELRLSLVPPYAKTFLNTEPPTNIFHDYYSNCLLPFTRSALPACGSPAYAYVAIHRRERSH